MITSYNKKYEPNRQEHNVAKSHTISSRVLMDIKNGVDSLREWKQRIQNIPIKESRSSTQYRNGRCQKGENRPAKVTKTS